MPSNNRLVPKQTAPDFTVTDIQGKERSLSDYKGKKVMLSFYRYASCSFCNLRIAELIKVYPELSKDIEFLAFFQSPTEKILSYAGSQKPPFPIFPDPERKVYEIYQVNESSKMKFVFGLTNILKLVNAFSNGFIKGKKDGDLYSIPADFLINVDQTIHTAYYGRDISDHISVSAIQQFTNE
ncbi:AhpC/TSA family protein [bacterium]|nr:AhpC/TSA family protein [bacterium]